MTDYISREEVYPLAKKICDAYNSGEYSPVVMPYKILDWIDDIPAADVVEVVRCKDCKYYFKDDEGYEMCDNSEGYDHTTEDGFCAWAKRKEVE